MKQVEQKLKKSSSTSNEERHYPFPYNHAKWLQPFFYPDTSGTIPLSYSIDTFKGLTPLFCLGLVFYYNQSSNPTMMTYTALHGTYGILWVIKSIVFGDKKWNEPKPLFFHLLTSVILAGYWMGPFGIASTNYHQPMWVNCLAIVMFCFGSFLHFGADLQKTVQLQYNPGKLITNLLWSRIRNPNYFGELLIYSSFLILTLNPFAIFSFNSSFWFYWVPNMWVKEKSLSRYEEFKKYKGQSWFLVPFVY